MDSLSHIAETISSNYPRISLSLVVREIMLVIKSADSLLYGCIQGM